MDRRPRHWRAPACALAALGLLLVASCGDDDSSSATPTSTAGSTSGASSSAAPTSAAAQEVCTEARKGGELTFSAGSLKTLGMDPTVSYGFGLSGGSQLIAM